jgi:hypothetical protein
VGGGGGAGIGTDVGIWIGDDGGRSMRFCCLTKDYKICFAYHMMLKQIVYLFI